PLSQAEIMADLHEAVFSWPDAGAHDVIVTGTFDNWSSSIHMTKTPSGFEAKVKVPWGQKILYKFVVDGTWLAAQGQPTELDGWTVNNFYHAPEKP
ncbi:hypothetical protein PUNSTDRAFT_24152, partial [Punctularia strigosozonata HHB-11173 SS5]|uniref:uncharacterized protein n=1 Tax=Punctularia strigosozonata (strain HHB-11173) TaxID=741275 RepID=UPI0004417B51